MKMRLKHRRALLKFCYALRCEQLKEARRSNSEKQKGYSSAVRRYMWTRTAYRRARGWD